MEKAPKIKDNVHPAGDPFPEETATTRTEALLGREATARLAAAHVMLVGLGGVGGYVLEALCRVGIGRFTLVDFDTISLTNLNRQILATRANIGMKKTEAAAARVASLFPKTRVSCFDCRLTTENAGEILSSAHPDILIDAIDDVRAKVALAVAAAEQGTPELCSLGTANRLDPSAFRITDLSETSGCPLARAMRQSLRRAGITHLPVLVSDETPRKSLLDGVRLGSVSYVPAAAGLLLAAETVRRLTESVG